MPDVEKLLELLQQAQPKALEDVKAVGATRGAPVRIYNETYGLLETKLLQLQIKGRQERSSVGTPDESPYLLFSLNIFKLILNSFGIPLPFILICFEDILKTYWSFGS